MRTLFASSSVFALILGVSVNACSDKNQFAPNDVSLNSSKFGVDSSEDHQKSGSAGAGDGTTKSLASGEMVNVLKAPEIKVVIKSGGAAGSGSGSSGSSGGSDGSSSGSSGSSSGSEGSGSSSSGSSSGSGMIVNNGLPQGLKNGIIGGNFDLDTYTSFDKNGVLDVNSRVHTHMYAQYDQTGVNFFEIRDENTKNIGEVIPSGVPFVFVVYNSSLSSSPVLSVNGNRVLPKDYDPKVSNGASSTVFHLGSASIQNSTPLTGFSINFSMDDKNRLAGTIIALDPTDAKEQTNTENLYRNGAFTIRAVRPENARNSPTDRTGVLWEGALYCHDCNKLPTIKK